MVLDDVFSVEIRIYLLVVPPQEVQNDGSMFTNKSGLDLMLDPLAGDNGNDVTHIGRPFFSSSYLASTTMRAHSHLGKPILLKKRIL